MPHRGRQHRYGKSITNCCRLIKLVDRMYIYDNSRENQTAELLFRIAEDEIIRQYIQILPR